MSSMFSRSASSLTLSVWWDLWLSATSTILSPGWFLRGKGENDALSLCKKSYTSTWLVLRAREKTPLGRLWPIAPMTVTPWPLTLFIGTFTGLSLELQAILRFIQRLQLVSSK